MDERHQGRPLAIDSKAASASQTEPAFVARPEGAPVYYGFESALQRRADPARSGVASADRAGFHRF